MNQNNIAGRKAAEGLSYFALLLRSYLAEQHPDKLSDHEFIAARADSAADSYADAVRNGFSHSQADEIAAEVLFSGLHFSPCMTLVNVLWNEYAGLIDEDEARQKALDWLPLLSDVLAGYEFTDDFADSPHYGRFYTELTGEVSILLEDGL